MPMSCTHNISDDQCGCQEGRVAPSLLWGCTQCTIPGQALKSLATPLPFCQVERLGPRLSGRIARHGRQLWLEFSRQRFQHVPTSTCRSVCDKEWEAMPMTTKSCEIQRQKCILRPKQYCCLRTDQAFWRQYMTILGKSF